MENQRKQRALVIFAREPESGCVKTRLQRGGLTPGYTQDLYKAFIEDTFSIAEQADCDHVFVYAAFHKEKTGFFDRYRSAATVQYQEGEDLGARMHNAFMDCFLAGYTDVVLIGSDCLALKPVHLDEAFAALDHFDGVLGPTADGGYYLIGLNSPHRVLFENQDWGSSTVYDKTLSQAHYLDLDMHGLAQRQDIDTTAELITFLKTSPADFPAARTRQWVKENPLPLNVLW